MTGTNRNIRTVAAEMLQHIPESETDLRRAIEFAIDAVCDNVPQSVAKGWVSIYSAMINFYPLDDEREEWHNTVEKIWSGKE